MAVWEPQKLSTKLGRLFDAGYSNVDTFARECGESPKLIEAIVNRPALRISRGCEMRIRKVLSAYLRLHPELYHDPGPAEPVHRHKVVEIRSHRKDERRFELYDTRGRWRGTWVGPADEIDEAEIGWLWRVLRKKDPDGIIKVLA
jgi:hypothetical protein